MRNLFILAGNGPYENRGCEAIVRGTVEILSKCFENSEFLVYSHFVSQQQYLSQVNGEKDKRITHKGFVYAKKYSFRWIFENIIERLSPESFQKYLYKNMLRYLPDAKAILSVGGDNYSLDYGKPKYFLDMNDLIISRKKPLILWGASVGPFSDNPKYEKLIIEHLRKVVIFARESETVDYLASKGLTDNVSRVSDPAFLMAAEGPSTEKLQFEIKEGAIGINLSPLMAKYVTGGDLFSWTKLAAQIIESVRNELKRPVYLIPHVTMPHNDDFLFMQDALSLIEDKHDLVLVPSIFNAAESKWIIGKMSIFAGARTHSVIAAFSSGVPALSFTYSSKGVGIGFDCLETKDFCLKADEIEPNLVVRKIKEIDDNSSLIRSKLRVRIEEIRNKSMASGLFLRSILFK